MIGKVISKYKIETLLGKGSMGEIYSGINTVTQQKVIIRRIDQQQISGNIEKKLRIKNDLFILSQLSNQAIAQIYEYVISGEELFSVSEFVEGVPINRFLEKSSSDRTAYVSLLDSHLLPRIINALKDAHSKGICHGHLRPANIIITKDDDLKIINFGFAELSELTKNANNYGIIEYLSPEQIQKRSVDARSDIYSLGVILFELIGGRKPYAGNLSETEISAKIANEPFPLTIQNTAGIPEKYINLIKKATEKFPENRISIAQLKDELVSVNNIAPVIEKPKPQVVYQKPSVVMAPPPRPAPIKPVPKKVPAGVYLAGKKKNSGKFVTIAIAIFVLLLGYVLVRNIANKANHSTYDNNLQAMADSIAMVEQQMNGQGGMDTSNLSQPLMGAEDSIYLTAEEMPVFPDGQKGLDNWIRNAIKFPEAARQSGISGDVIVSFIVEKDGRVSNVKIVKDIGGGCGQESVRAVNSMPGWKPGLQNGKKVRVQYTLPVKFMLQ